MKQIKLSTILAVLAIASCQQMEYNGDTVNRGLEMTFTACSGEDQTKTVVGEEGRILWSPKDTIKVFYGNTASGKFVSTNSTPQAVTTFSGSFNTSAGNTTPYYLAVYPYSEDSEYKNGSVSLNIPSRQTAEDGTFDPTSFPSMAVSGSDKLTFYNVCGGICFTVSRDDITSVTLKGRKSEALAGRILAVSGEDGKPEVREVTNAHRSVTVTTQDGSCLKKGTRYYMSLVPGKLEGGFTLTFRTADLKEGTFSSRNAVEVKRSVFGTIKEVDQNISYWNTVPANPTKTGAAGDSLALIAINHALGGYGKYPTAEPMSNWKGVQVWESGPFKGRVRVASFQMFAIDDVLPYQLRYLTAAEELSFYSNTNTFIKNLDPGEDICTLENLKRLTIRAHGLVSLPESFSNLRNLEYLNLSGNNFESVPELICKENFPKLHALVLNANQRYTISDISTTTKTNFGGLVNECDVDASGKRSFPVRFLKWNELDTLVLSVNFMQGSIPSLENDRSFPRWTAAEVESCDTLPARLVGLPKVLPHTMQLSINLNRLSGELPEWLLFHPCLDLWVPDLLVFPQEGKDLDGNVCEFSNAPATLDYYYDEYVNKAFNPNKKN